MGGGEIHCRKRRGNGAEVLTAQAKSGRKSWPASPACGRQVQNDGVGVMTDMVVADAKK